MDFLFLSCMIIGIDMLGGDFAPAEAANGIADYLKYASAPVSLHLIGDDAGVQAALLQAGLAAETFSITHAPQHIGMHEHPTKALRDKPKSSIALGFRLLAAGTIDAFISAGNTGAMLVGALYSLKPLEGVLRPTISTLIPKEDGSTGLLLDVGLNTDCKPEHLNQFAVMGSVYAKTILGIEAPRVALLNIGEEEGKGNLLCRAAYPLLQQNRHINFTGNAEGRDLFLNKADVMVCDGFTGNVVLKMAESLFHITQSKLITHDYFSRFNFENYGGTPVLGVAKPVIIGHGISKSSAFKNMIFLAHQLVATDVMQKLSNELKQ